MDIYGTFLGLGLRSLAEKLDKDLDLMCYVKTCQRTISGPRVIQRGDVPYKEYTMVTMHLQ